MSDHGKTYFYGNTMFKKSILFLVAIVLNNSIHSAEESLGTAIEAIVKKEAANLVAFYTDIDESNRYGWGTAEPHNWGGKIEVYLGKRVVLKQSSDRVDLSWNIIPGEVTVQFFKHSDNPTRRTYRRLNKNWSRVIEFNTVGYGAVSYRLDTEDARTWKEIFSGKPEKLAFRKPDVEMFAQLMRSGDVQYNGLFSLEGLRDENSAKCIAECLKAQKRVALCYRHKSSRFDMTRLISSLNDNPHLTDLHLGSNFLQGPDLDAIANLLNKNAHIKHFYIQYPTMSYIEKLLQENTSLQTLGVKEIKEVTAVQAVALSNALEQNKTLKKLYLTTEFKFDSSLKLQLQNNSRIVFLSNLPPWKRDYDF